MRRRYVAIGLGLIAAVAVAVPAIGGSGAFVSVSKPVKKSIKKAVKKEVKKQIAKATGPQGPPGPAGARGATGGTGPRGPSNASLDLNAVVGLSDTFEAVEDADLGAGSFMIFAKAEARSAGATGAVECQLVFTPGTGPEVLLDATTATGLGNQTVSLLGARTTSSPSDSVELRCRDAGTDVDLPNIKLGVIKVQTLGDLD